MMQYLKLFYNFLEETEDLDEAALGRLVRQMMEYAATGNENGYLRGNERMLWKVYKGQIDRDHAKYEDISLKRSKAGRAAHPANAVKCMQDNENEKEKEKEQDQEKEQEESRRCCANGNFSSIQEYVSGNLGHLSAGNLRELAQYAKELPEALIFCAVDECCAADKRRFSYLKSILRAYVQEGIQTVEAAKERSERFQAARTSGKNPALNYAQRSYAEEDFSSFFEDLG